MKGIKETPEDICVCQLVRTGIGTNRRHRLWSSEGWDL